MLFKQPWICWFALVSTSVVKVAASANYKPSLNTWLVYDDSKSVTKTPCSGALLAAYLRANPGAADDSRAPNYACHASSKTSNVRMHVQAGPPHKVKQYEIPDKFLANTQHLVQVYYRDAKCTQPDFFNIFRLNACIPRHADDSSMYTCTAGTDKRECFVNSCESVPKEDSYSYSWGFLNECSKEQRLKMFLMTSDANGKLQGLEAYHPSKILLRQVAVTEYDDKNNVRFQNIQKLVTLPLAIASSNKFDKATKSRQRVHKTSYGSLKDFTEQMTANIHGTGIRLHIFDGTDCVPGLLARTYAVRGDKQGTFSYTTKSQDPFYQTTTKHSIEVKDKTVSWNMAIVISPKESYDMETFTGKISQCHSDSSSFGMSHRFEDI